MRPPAMTEAICPPTLGAQSGVKTCSKKWRSHFFDTQSGAPRGPAPYRACAIGPEPPPHHPEGGGGRAGRGDYQQLRPPGDPPLRHGGGGQGGGPGAVGACVCKGERPRNKFRSFFSRRVRDVRPPSAAPAPRPDDPFKRVPPRPVKLKTSQLKEEDFAI